MSFKEISAWIVLAAFSFLLWKWAGPLIEAGTLNAEVTAGDMLGFMIAFVVIVVIAHVVLAILSPRNADAPEDERDRKIELFASRAGGFVLGGATLVALALAVRDGAGLLANVLFIGLVASEIAKNFWQVILYRRGA